MQLAKPKNPIRRTYVMAYVKGRGTRSASMTVYGATPQQAIRAIRRALQQSGTLGKRGQVGNSQDSIAAA